MWQRYGFVDAFNPLNTWYDSDVIGIDVGITMLMAENHRSQMVWSTFMTNPEVLAAFSAVNLKYVPNIVFQVQTSSVSLCVLGGLRIQPTTKDTKTHEGNQVGRLRRDFEAKKSALSENAQDAFGSPPPELPNHVMIVCPVGLAVNVTSVTSYVELSTAPEGTSRNREGRV